MEILSANIEGLKIIKNFRNADDRGSFTKLINDDEFKSFGIDFQLMEQYYSISSKDTVRGMHFQIPPYDHAKIVHVIKGSVLDVVLDLRKDSKTYGMCDSVLLSAKEATSLYIPKGFAHGFKSLEDDTVMLYNVSSVYNKDHDCGIRWDSIPFDWNIENPITSARDKTFDKLENFVSPF